MADVTDLVNHLEGIRDEARTLVETRWEEFENLKKNGDEEELFAELSFCVLTANWSAQGGIKAQKTIRKRLCNIATRRTCRNAT